jgi:hypothetical protein
MTPPLARAAVRLRRRPGRPRTRPERSPATVVKVSAVAPVSPRLLDRAGAARYCAVAADTIDRLIAAGTLRPVRLPNGQGGDLRRVLLDRADLDRLIDSMKAEAAP